MNIPSNPAAQFVRGPHEAAYAAIPVSRRMYWLVQREFWESRSLYIAPLAVATVFLFGFLIRTIRIAHALRSGVALTAEQERLLVGQPYGLAAVLLMATTFLVSVFYCLDALHGERRDRSILFWKSLPVSDLMTVLSKAIIVVVALPLLTFAITVATQWLMLLMQSAVLAANGLSVAALWTQVSLLQMSVMLLYHLVAVHGLWYAPIYCWLLLVSAWARRAVFLWAALPLLVIGVVEKIAFNTSHFGSMLGHRIAGDAGGADFILYGMTMDPLTHLDPGRFLLSPGLWIGLAIAAGFLAGAVRLRHQRGPI